MKLTPEQTALMREAAEPLAEFLIAHCHPHCQIVVDSHRIELHELVAADNIQPSVIIGDVDGWNGEGLSFVPPEHHDQFLKDAMDHGFRNFSTQDGRFTEPKIQVFWEQWKPVSLPAITPEDMEKVWKLADDIGYNASDRHDQEGTFRILIERFEHHRSFDRFGFEAEAAWAVGIGKLDRDGDGYADPDVNARWKTCRLSKPPTPHVP